MGRERAGKTGKKTGKVCRALKTLGIILLCCALFLYVLLPAGMGAIASVRAARAIEPPPDGYSAEKLTAADGTELACWYAPGENGACIILVHGAKSNLASLTRHAAILNKAGFGVLAQTLRGHGGSGGRGNAFGWACGQDISAAVDFLKNKGVDRIGALGLSLGGEVLLSAAADEPEIIAIAADGATQRCLADYFALETNRSLWRSWTTRVMYATVRLLSGQTPPERTILSSVKNASRTRFLFIAAGNVENESIYGGLFAEAAGDSAALFVVPGAGHTQGLAVATEEYTAWVIGFFEDAL